MLQDGMSLVNEKGKMPLRFFGASVAMFYIFGGPSVIRRFFYV